jgi:DNA-binding HxlR family transcriptional regulator
MKLEKMTRVQKTAEKRWYDDACGTAMALELVGERWSLLIVRELMFGGRRFGELKAALNGISANVLTQRLESMEVAGILVKRKLPPPASVQIYELTRWGYESERAIQELGRWATRSPQHDPTLPLSAASLMLSFRTMLSAERSAGLAATIGFRLGDERFSARLENGTLDVVRDDPAGADVIFSGTPHGIAAVTYGGFPMEEAEKAELLSVEGDRALAERFVTLFPLPPKWTDDEA